jgi:UBX domain-containing protein 1
MRYDDPANEQILAEINAGYVSLFVNLHPNLTNGKNRKCNRRAPPQILNVTPGQPVELRWRSAFRKLHPFS